MIQIFKFRDPALLISGQAVSNLGDGVASVAFAILVLTLTHHSPVALSLFAAARMVPLVGFLLVGGVLVDRNSRRLMLLVSDSGRAIVTAAIVVLAVLGILQFWELLVAGVIFGAFDAVFMPAMSALQPEIVPDELLPAMNAVRPLANNFVGGMLGPAIGGAVAAWSTTFAIGLDSATFVVSATTLALMRPTPKPVRAAPASMMAEIKAGLNFIRSETWIWSTLAFAGLSNAFVLIPVFTFLPFVVIHTLHASRVWVGITSATSGLFGTLGTIYAGTMKTPVHRMRVMWGVWVVGGLVAVVMGFAANTWELLLVPICMSPGIVIGNVIWETMLQRETPREMLGRVTSADWFVSLGIAPIGVVVAGALISATSVRDYFIFAVIAITVPGVLGLFSKHVNAVDAPERRARVTAPVADFDDRASGPAFNLEGDPGR
jgi:MFS family permease